ncbi:hypothetical protein GPJ56_002584 [Histomonas meleagridis]|uniref:uncharacterized protein n=1 Tax=Histomonas meleagridis TaxID=135588 RepID=UPI00355976E4|nr:hypothetical protein GPJ56_002584 [Histomonas meleagridis]KAH0801376.1 hypothetical protein GO595_005971 [Histomonas meleagridis]
MLSSITRALSSQTIMGSIRDAAKNVAAEFIDNGTKQFFTRWSDHIYEEGSKITDQKQLEKYAAERNSEIDALKRQVQIQKMYQNVEIPLK